jgi:hypothetical protein
MLWLAVPRNEEPLKQPEADSTVLIIKAELIITNDFGSFQQVAPTYGENNEIQIVTFDCNYSGERKFFRLHSW